MKYIFTLITILCAIQLQAQTFYTQPIQATRPYLGQHGNALLEIDFASTDLQIRKPLIVVEGFEVGTLLNPENEFGTNNLTIFRDDIRSSNSIELRNLIWVNSSQEYDIIYVNWNNGVDYMQRNAYVLEEVIKWVNDNKVGSEKNVVLGQSMGGVIARYALSDMEARGETHDTRLFISQDAPQQGANLPLSYQYMYRHVTNQYITASSTLFGGVVTVPIIDNLIDGTATDYLSILDTPASRQLLKNWSAINYTVDNSLHDSFYNELKGLNSNNGYPQQGDIRNVAISNGSECGTTQTFNAGDHLANVQMNEKLSFLENLIFTIISPVIGTAAGLTIDPDFFRVGFLGLIPGSSRFIIDFQAKALSYTYNAHIYKGLIRYKKRILWIFNSQVTITHVNKNQPSGILPFDWYGGGFYDTSGYSDVIDVGIGNITVEVEDKFSFIPTASALDIGVGNVNLNDTDYRRKYVGGQPPSAPKNSPFDNFTTAFTSPNDNDNNNEEHLEFNRRNGDWLAAEIIGTDIETTDCSFVCENATINGSNTLCTSEVFSIQSSMSSDAVVTWSVNNTNVVSLSNTTGTTTTLTTPPNSYRTSVVLTSTISSVRCSSTVSISKTIRVGKPDTPTYLDGPTVVATGAFVRYQAGYAEGATSYKWWLPYPYTVVTSYNYQDSRWQMRETTHTSLTAYTGMGKISGYVQIMGVNDCGCGSVNYLKVKHATGGGGSGGIPIAPPQDDILNSNSNYFQIYPNPSKGMINVTLQSSTRVPLNQGYIEGKLFDLYGNIKRTVKILNNKAFVDTSGLNTGIYVLKIYVNDTVESHQVIVK